MIPLRDENPTHRFPFFTVLIILINVAVFVYQMSLGRGAQAFIIDYGVIPVEVWNGRNLSISNALSPYLSLITSMFLHGGIGHILGNMWFLWIFGDNIEDYLGHIQFIFFYFVTGVIATLAHAFFEPTSQIPLVGASGAISGILGAYLVLHPKIRILTLIPIGFFLTTIRVPAVIFLGLWMVMQLLGVLNPTGPVAYAAHIGGFVAGIILIFVCSKPERKQSRPRYQAWGRARRRF